MTGLRIGLVGCGRLAEVGYLPALRAARGLRLVAVADPVRERREHLAGLARGAGQQAVAVESAAGLLAGTPVDGLVLATPAAAHLGDARLAAAAGVRTLVEKPPAPDVRTAADLAAVRPAPRVGFNRRFDPGVAEVRDAAAGTGGRPQLTLELRYRRRTWRAHTVTDEALLDLGPHLIDLARWITGREVAAVRGASLTRERAALELELTDGRATVRCATDRPHRERIELRTGDGRRVADTGRGGVLANLRDRLAPGGGHPLVASLTRQLEAWVGALEGAPAPALGTAADGLAAMAAVDAARASARRGGARIEVTVPEAGDPQAGNPEGASHRDTPHDRRARRPQAGPEHRDRPGRGGGRRQRDGR